MKKAYILTGGTTQHVAAHLALSFPSYGRIGYDLNKRIMLEISNYETNLVPTAMALSVLDSGYDRADYYTLLSEANLRKLESNEDVSRLLDHLLSLDDTKVIYMPIALADWKVEDDEFMIDHNPVRISHPNPKRRRVSSKDAKKISINLVAAEKILSTIRSVRKDVFLVGWSHTAGVDTHEQYLIGLEKLKKSHCNLVFANDTVTQLNMVIVPEEEYYGLTTDRYEALRTLVKMVESRSTNTFTRSTVISDAPKVNWTSMEVPSSLRDVVNFCIQNKAYQPFLGKTAGHFAFRNPDGTITTSIRGSNFNNLEDVGMVVVKPVGLEQVIAYGAKPSVGGQSQRIIFKEHPELDNIVHFHCEKKESSKVPVVEQWKYECGSHECGQNTSSGIKEMEPGIWAVMLDKHGPNIVYNKNVDPSRVIQFILDNFKLGQKTGGPVSSV